MFRNEFFPEMTQHKDRCLLVVATRKRLHAKYSLQMQQAKLLAILGHLAGQPPATPNVAA